MEQVQQLNEIETSLLLQLLQCQKAQAVTESCLQTKKEENKLLQARIGTINDAIVRKLQENQQRLVGITQIQQELDMLRQFDCQLYEKIQQAKDRIDCQILENIAIAKVPVQMNLGDEEPKEGSQWENLLGIKVKFIPQESLLASKWEIHQDQHQLSVRKISGEPGYTRLISQHPFPSRGRYYLKLRYQSQHFPAFAIGLTTQSPFVYPFPALFPPVQLSFDTKNCAISSHEGVLSRFQGTLPQEGELILVIDCTRRLFIVIIDRVQVCQADTAQFKDEYCYLFMGLKSAANILAFDCTFTPAFDCK